MIKFVCARRFVLPSLAVSCALLGLAGCSRQPAVSTTDEAKAFAGDPAVKARAGAALREKAQQGAAQAMARAQAQAKPPATPGAPATQSAPAPRRP